MKCKFEACPTSSVALYAIVMKTITCGCREHLGQLGHTMTLGGRGRKGRGGGVVEWGKEGGRESIRISKKGVYRIVQ